MFAGIGANDFDISHSFTDSYQLFLQASKVLSKMFQEKLDLDELAIEVGTSGVNVKVLDIVSNSKYSIRLKVYPSISLIE